MLSQYSNLAKIKTHVPEGLTLVFEAPQRYGKTLGMVMWAFDEFTKGRRIFSNIQLGFPHEPLQFREIKLQDGVSPFWNGHIVIDELNFYFDGRRSMKQDNLEFSAFLLQQKKQGCNITGTTHNLESLDIRFRQNYDYVIRPRVYPAWPVVPPRVIALEIESGPRQRRFRKTLFLECMKYLGMYDTAAVYDPFKSDEEDEDEPRRKPKRRVTL